MYLSYFNLHSKPFQISPDPNFFWMGRKHKTALAAFHEAVLEGKGFLALTGEVGTGKTTIINALMNRLNGRVIFAKVSDPALEPLDFLNLIGIAFNAPRSFDNYNEASDYLQGFLLNCQTKGQQVVLVIDEAQRLKPNIINEIDLLGKLNPQERMVLNLFLVGQTELDELFDQPCGRQFKRAIAVWHKLKPLTLKETGTYIRYRLKIAGTRDQIFSSNSIREVYAFSKGHPRLINILCDLALLKGYLKEVHLIDAGVIRECAAKLPIASAEGAASGTKIQAKPAVKPSLLPQEEHLSTPFECYNKTAKQWSMASPPPARVDAKVPVVNGCREAAHDLTSPPCAPPAFRPVTGSVAPVASEPLADRQNVKQIIAELIKQYAEGLVLEYADELIRAYEDEFRKDPGTFKPDEAKQGAIAKMRQKGARAKHRQTSFYMEEKREHKRSSFFIAIDYATENRVIRDFIDDISVGGVFIETREQFNLGQEILMTFSIPRFENHFKVSGHVLRIESTGIAVKFDKAIEYSEKR